MTAINTDLLGWGGIGLSRMRKRALSKLKSKSKSSRWNRVAQTVRNRLAQKATASTGGPLIRRLTSAIQAKRGRVSPVTRRFDMALKMLTRIRSEI